MSGEYGLLEPHITYLLPSLVAIILLVTKLVIFWLARQSDRQISPWLWGFLIGLFGTNLFELLSYLLAPNLAEGHALIGLLCFYACLIAATLSFLGLSLEFKGRLIKPYKQLMAAFAVITAAVLIIPNAAISGVESIGYSVKRIPGPYYWVLQLGIVGPLVLGAVNLRQCVYDAYEWVNSRKALAALFASLPFIFVLVAAAVYMHIAQDMPSGAQYNAAIILSLAVNATLIVLFYTEEEHRMFRFLSCIPKTQEHELMVRIRRELFKSGVSNMKEITRMIQREIARDAVKRYGGNQSQAARALSVSRQTLHRKLGGDERSA